MNAQSSAKISWYYYILGPVLLALTTILTYYPSLHYDFQFDDLASITKHFFIRHYSLRTLLFSGTRWISYWLNSIYYALGKFDPFYYRVGNVAIHITNGLLIFYILLLLFNRRPQSSFFNQYAYQIALLTSLLFLLHPVQTQTVSYVIQGQLEGLAALSALSMIASFLMAMYSTKRWQYGMWTIIVCVIALLSCGTKEIAIIAPGLLILIDWFFISHGHLQSFFKNLPIHGLVSTIVFSGYLYLLRPIFFTQILGLQLTAKNNIGNMITQSPADIITPGHFFISQFKVILHYIWIFIWPFNISVEYDWKLVEQFWSPDCFGPLCILILLAIGVYALLRRQRTSVVGFCIIWFMFCLAPRSSIVPSPELLVDYKTYLASFGLLCIIAICLIKAGIYIKHKFMIPAFGSYASWAAISILLCLLTMHRNTVWQSGLKFWGNVIHNAPRKARAYNNYGVELSQKLNQYAESIPYFKKAIAMDKLYPDPCNNLAVAYAAIGKIDEAIDALKQGLRINPYYPEGYNNLASFLIMKKDYAQAQQALEAAILLRPYYGKAYLNMGRIYLDQHELEKAWECFKKCCLEADLDNEVGFDAYGKVSLMLKKYDAAIFAYKKVLDITPNNPEATFNLGNAYFLTGASHEALAMYQRAYQQNPKDVRIWYNLGETYFIAQQYQQALQFFEKVRSLQQSYPTQLYLRIALCFEKLGAPMQARQLLTELLEEPLPEIDREMTKKQLLALNAQ